MWGQVRQDVWYAGRTLMRTPAVTAAAVVILALGIGATTAIFTVANGVLFQPLPFAEPERLVQFGSVGILEFGAYRSENRSFASLVFYSVTNKTLHHAAEPERITAVATEPGLFDLLGVRPLAGRTFTVTDAPNVAVVSESFRRRRFPDQTALDNWTIVLDGEPYTVVGVVPGHFQFPYGAAPMEVWIPTELPRTDNRFQRIDVAVGRLKPDVTVAAAAAEFRALTQRREPSSDQSRPVPMVSLTEAVVGRSRSGVLVLLGAAIMVLLIACANVANLLLSRAEARRREVAVRMALGASRGRLVRQFLSESLVLVLAASLAALGVAVAGTRLLLFVAGPQIPRTFEIGLDWRVSLFLFIVGLAAVLAFGLVPARYSLQSNLSEALNAQGNRSSPSRKSTALTNGLVVAEIALAFVLLTGAGLLFRALVNIEQAPIGIVTDRVLTLRMETRGLVAAQTGGSDPSANRETAQGRYFRQIEDRVKAIPGVRDAGLVTRLPIQSPGNTGQFTITGRILPPNRRGFPVRLREASPGYFRALGIPVRAGRVFTERDSDIVVNEALVREHFQGENPIGRVLDRGTIIGVVGDVRQNARLPAEPEIYRPLSRTSYTAATLVISTLAAPPTFVGAVRTAVRDINRNQAVFDVRTMDDVITASRGDLNLSLSLIGLFAALAVLLAMAGIYAVVSYSVAVRRRELGIRSALGADAVRLLAVVFRRGAFLIGGGLVIGIGGALALTRLLGALLFEVAPTDPLTFIATTILLVGVALAACLSPARRAMKVDVITVLRDE